MLSALKFVQGAIGKRDYIPAITHFLIEDGRVIAFNGNMALSSPIPLDINCMPKANDLIKALSNCCDTITMSLTTTGRLKVQSGAFKAFVQCTTAEAPHPKPSGESVAIDGEVLMEALTTLSPFVGTDASRLWMNGILLDGNSAYATNNTILVQYWTGFNLPFKLNIPRQTVNEMLRIGQVPLTTQADNSSATFHYEGDRWIRTQLFSDNWPDLDKILSVESNPKPISDDIFKGLETIKPFVDGSGRFYIRRGKVWTHDPDLEEHVDAGASYDISDATTDAMFNIEMFLILKNRIDTIDLSKFADGKPCPFFKGNLRGVIVGMKL